jgi:hypothetical protein
MGRTRSWRARARLTIHRSHCLTSTRRWDWMKFHFTPITKSLYIQRVPTREKTPAIHPLPSECSPIPLDSVLGPWAESAWDVMQQQSDALQIAAAVQLSRSGALDAIKRFLPHRRSVIDSIKSGGSAVTALQAGVADVGAEALSRNTRKRKFKHTIDSCK